MQHATIYDGLRTPFGRHAGALASVRPDDLLAGLLKEVVRRAGIPGAAIEDVVAGCTNQAGEDARDVARHAALLAGLPETVGGVTLNRLCGSAMSAIADAARAIRCGEGDLFLAGGVESMTRAPFVMAKQGTAWGREVRVHDSTIGARFSNPRLDAVFGTDSMPETADNIARDLGIGRAESDAYALRSQEKYEAARAAGFFDGEILPVEVAQGRGRPPLVVAADEHPRPLTTLASLEKLRPLFEGGVVTAGNASGVNDGAAVLLLGSQVIADRHGLVPRGRILASAVAGVAPRVMGLGPVPASRKALERAGLRLADMDVIEINEAFATQVLGCLRGLDLTAGDDRLNPNGGAIAIGHPLGASGARIVTTALRELERRSGRYALVTMCIGVGQGIAMVIERA
ncbi:3-oxoadipyl-CoA thiolase [Pinisolibacter aquiterrae]|uniref:3-oxoadipyl-CoA thiolase n=1 Tax=Pinisolibacter aquiterrae TaxID=2815579 RepID=UPI001C3E1E48|nr:3-oxoadipyl-CoA thiolase [Pinisolibacter aquiterrae]MBV5265448.1 3-oxoadipyl-CoA thiolase [Pinisolibacter aquiterrae]MCC8236081.1 3-oxoadipyl-CoA thiolase [Pinisolibacter aquiterrae]